MRLMLVALGLLVLGIGCVSSRLASAPIAPMLSRAGQFEVGVAARPLAPRRALDATGTVAVTDHMRLGASIAGAALTRAPQVGLGDGDETDTKRFLGLYGEGLLGLEDGRGALRFGGFVGAGYGETDWLYVPCKPHAFGCAGRETRMLTRYVRTFASGYFGVSPPGPYSMSVGLRIPVDYDLERTVRRSTRASGEPFVSQSLTTKRGLRVEWQVMYARAIGIHFHLGVRLRFDLGRERSHADHDRQGGAHQRFWK